MQMTLTEFEQKATKRTKMEWRRGYTKSEAQARLLLNRESSALARRVSVVFQLVLRSLRYLLFKFSVSLVASVSSRREFLFWQLVRPSAEQKLHDVPFVRLQPVELDRRYRPDV